MSVVRFRPYRVRRVVTSEFLSSTSRFNKDFADEDLARSGLILDDMAGAAPDNMQLPEKALAGYHIPYFDVNGDVLTDAQQYSTMYRVKLKFPPLSKGGKYTQPSGEELSSYGLPSYVPYLYPCADLKGETIYCCEGEKKTVSFIKNLGLPAFGISGCNMWGNPSGAGGVHPWILDYFRIKGTKRVIIIPDGDIFKYDICTAYGTFAHALQQAGFEVTLLNPPDKIDDLIVQWGSDAVTRLANIPSLSPDNLVQTPASLAVKYNLAFKRTPQDKIIVHQHTSNVMRLMKDHPAFPKIWLNKDTNRVMLGETPAIPDHTEMVIANHMQHNFGLEKVSSKLIQTCMRALSRENESSPMLAYIQGVIWDGVERLDTWLADCWGVTDNAFSREVGCKWLVSACARMAVPGSKVDWMLIAIGPQGTGKTSMPGIIFKGHNVTLYGDHDNKDLHLLLHSALVVGFDELDSFSRKDSSLLKAMITTTEDMFRPPYGASVEVFPRRFTLYGCGNRHEFLQNDPSGQRRYAIVEVPRLLDFALLESIRDQLWAEAWQRYQAGKTKWWEVEGASENAKQFEVANILEERITQWIDRELVSKVSARIKDGQFRFTMSELMKGIDETPSQGAIILREAAAILKGLGYAQKVTTIAGRAQRVYIVPV